LTPNATPEATSNNGSNAGRPATGKSLAKQAKGDWSTPRAACNVTGARTLLPPSEGGRSSKPSLEDQARASRDWPTPIKEDSESRTANGTLTDAVRENWPTPTTMDAAGFEGRPDVGRTSPNSGRTLSGAVKDWPTPQTTDANAAARHTTTTGIMHAGTTLTDATRAEEQPEAEPAPNWLTPQSRDHKGISQKVAKGEYTGGLPDQLAGLHDRANGNTSGNLPASSPRPVLNPDWVETLMGFPIGWTDVDVPTGGNGSARSATRSSRKSPKSSPAASATSCDASTE
jgi:hypothetical protein